MSGLTLDAGALIAFERNDRKVVAIISRALKSGLRLAVPAGVAGTGSGENRIASILTFTIDLKTLFAPARHGFI